MIVGPWLTVTDVAKYLCVLKDTMYCWPPHHIGRLWKFQQYQVDGWVRAFGAGHDSEIMERAQVNRSKERIA